MSRFRLSPVFATDWVLIAVGLTLGALWRYPTSVTAERGEALSHNKYDGRFAVGDFKTRVADVYKTKLAPRLKDKHFRPYAILGLGIQSHY